jgi:GT2 family glycosyltransferase
LERTHRQGKTCAVTVAYENPEVLSVLFESLKLQTRRIDGIVAVDNSESEVIRKANQKIFDEFAEAFEYAEYLSLGVNTGSAGGFRRAMELAHKDGFDWIWLLDQDGFMRSDCLERLLAYADRAEILCPRVLSAEDEMSDLAFSKRINFWGRLLPVFPMKDSPQMISLFCTHGALLSRRAIDMVGYYDDKNFFFRWEDIDYGYRAHSLGVPMLLVPDAIAFHPEKAAPKAANVYPKGLVSRAAFLVRNLFPLFLVYDWRIDSPGDAMNYRSYSALIRKHIRGYKFWGAFIFSALCLVVLKCVGAKVPLRKAIRGYFDLRGDV